MSDPLKSDPLLLVKRNLGYLTGTIALLVGLPGLVFRWTTLGRKYWPLATLVLMGLVWIGR